MGKYNINIFGLQQYNKHGLQRPLADDQFVLDKDGPDWLVYFFEKGQKHELKIFDDEDEACSYLLNWISGI